LAEDGEVFLVCEVEKAYEAVGDGDIWALVHVELVDRGAERQRLLLFLHEHNLCVCVCIYIYIYIKINKY